MESLLSPQEDMTQPPQEREAGPAPRSPSVKVRLQQLRKRQKAGTRYTSRNGSSLSPADLPKASMTPDGCNGRLRERAIPKPKARRPKPRKGPER